MRHPRQNWPRMTETSNSVAFRDQIPGNCVAGKDSLQEVLLHPSPCLQGFWLSARLSLSFLSDQTNTPHGLYKKHVEPSLDNVTGKKKGSTIVDKEHVQI
jgi:hypothetical protein